MRAQLIRIALGLCVIAAPVAAPVAAGAASAAPAAASSGGPSAAAKPVPIYAFNSQWVITTIGRLRAGATVRIAEDSHRPGQRWLLRADGTVRPSASPGLCLTAPSATAARSRAQFKVRACGGSSQHFSRRFPAASSPIMFISPRGHAKQCLTVTRFASSPIQVAGCRGSEFQAWATSNLADPTSPFFAIAAIGPGFGSALTASLPVTARSGLVVRRQSPNLGQFWISVQVSPTADVGARSTLRPLDDPSLCLTLSGHEAVGVRLRLASCENDLGSQQFIGVQIGFTTAPYWAMLLTSDARYCVTAASKPGTGRHLKIGRCLGGDQDRWLTGLVPLTPISLQFADLYLGNPSGAIDEAMDAPDDGHAGTKLELNPDSSGDESGAQIWTDLNPGAAPAGNPDGSMSLRPLYDMGLCLTVPGASFAVGTQLQVRACDGKPDQEFALASQPPSQIAGDWLKPFGHKSLCVGVSGGVDTGKPVELLHCHQAGNQTWSNWHAWQGWA